MSNSFITTVLLVEDNPGDARLLREMFNGQGSHQIDLTHVGSLSEAEKHLKGFTPDIILADLGLPDATGLETIRRIRAAAPGVPLVVLTGLDDETLAIQALQEGAQDYLVKGQIDTRGLLRALRCATERKRLERMKDDFVSSVSHELRTPLTSISASLGLLVEIWSAKLPQSAARLLTIAHTNSLRLVRLINDILDIEKMEAGRAVFKLGRVDVRTLIGQAIEGMRGFAEGSHVRIRLAEESSAGEVRADPDRLFQVLTNLLSNAIRFSPENGEVVINIEKGIETFRISVRDHGAGIPVEFKPHVFERFAQADATSATPKSGTGLGLSIVREIVNRLNGKAGFEDAPGGGALFYIELPAWNDTDRWQIDLDADTAEVRILVCEDDRATALEIRDRLREAGFASDLAYTVGAALARAGECVYAAIITDLNFPDGDGIDLILSLRAQAENSGTPIIVASMDFARWRTDARSSKLNVLDWFGKPIDFGLLIPLLKSSVAPALAKRARVLHVDDDHDMLAALAHALRATADVVSVDSIDAARDVLANGRIDLVVLDVVLGKESGLDLMPELHNRGNVIPVIIFSAGDAGLPFNTQVQAALQKSEESLQRLVTLVGDCLARPPTPRVEEVA